MGLGRLEIRVEREYSTVFFSCVRALFAKEAEALGLHEKQLIVCLVESLTTLDFGSE